MIRCACCGEPFADMHVWRKHLHGERCIDVRTDLAWRVDNNGHWTDRPGAPPPAWPGYQLYSDAQEVTYDRHGLP